MKKLFPLLFLLIFLSGCKSGPESAALEQTKNEEPLQWEIQLPSTGYQEMISFQDNLILVHTYESGSYLDLLSLSSNEVITSVEIPGIVSTTDGTLQCHETEIAYYNSENSSIDILDADLVPINSIPIPRNHKGVVVISSDISRAFFASDAGVFSMEIATGITHLLKDCRDSILSGCMFDSTILSCQDADGNPFYMFSSDGHSFSISEKAELFQSDGNLFTTVIHTQWEQYRVIGRIEGDKKIFLPKADEFYLVPELNSIITVSYNPGCTTISVYDIFTGKQIADYPTNSSRSILDFLWDNSTDSLLYLTSTIFDKYTICSLNLQKTKTTAAGDTVSECFSPDNPDTKGISALQDRIEQIEKKHQIGVSFSPESFSQLSSGITFVAGYRSSPYEDALNRLEQALAKLELCDFSVAAKNTPSKKIQIGIFLEVNPEGIPQNHASFWEKGDFYIALSCGDDLEDQLYHEIGRFLESRINSLGNYFDSWDEMNPCDFEYYNNYLHLNEELSDDDSYFFVSQQAMISPSEDRAELFRFALQEGNNEVFLNTPIQNKLRALSEGLRFVFHISDDTSPPWEQYLQ